MKQIQIGIYMSLVRLKKAKQGKKNEIKHLQPRRKRTEQTTVLHPRSIITLIIAQLLIHGHLHGKRKRDSNLESFYFSLK